MGIYTKKKKSQNVTFSLEIRRDAGRNCCYSLTLRWIISSSSMVDKIVSPVIDKSLS